MARDRLRPACKNLPGTVHYRIWILPQGQLIKTAFMLIVLSEHPKVSAWQQYAREGIWNDSKNIQDDFLQIQFPNKQICPKSI